MDIRYNRTEPVGVKTLMTIGDAGDGLGLDTFEIDTGPLIGAALVGHLIFDPPASTLQRVVEGALALCFLRVVSWR